MYICLPVKQKSNKALCLSLPAGVTMTRTQDLWHPVTFVCRRLHLWLMSISYPDLCVKEDHKHTHSNRGAPTQFFMSYQRSIFHLLSSSARMLTGIPSWGDGSGTCTHMLRRSLAHPTNTHTHTLTLLRAVVCFDWRGGRVVLTPLWHSIPFRCASLFTNYSEQNAQFNVCVSLGDVRVLIASGPSLLHTSLVSLLHQCLPI